MPCPDDDAGCEALTAEEAATLHAWILANPLTPERNETPATHEG